MDLDVIFFGNLVQQDEKLIIPEPELYQRPFIYIPLLELAPDIVDPQKQAPVFDFISSLEHQMEEFILLENLSEWLKNCRLLLL